MSDIFDNFFGLEAGERPVPTVAYTINNQQPVACTFIGSQPLFYMDIDADDEDLAYSDDPEMEFLAAELEALKREIEIYDNETLSLSGRVHDADQALKNIQEKVAQSQAHENISAPFEDIETLVNLISISQTARTYLKIAKENNVSITYSAQIKGAFYAKTAKKLFINPHNDIDVQILLMARELRRATLDTYKALINPMAFETNEAILANRAITADLSTQMVRIAWELQLADHKSAWELLKNSSLHDLARAFSCEAITDFRSLNDGRAATAAFECWFLSDRCRYTDRALIKDMLADHQGYISGKKYETTPHIIEYITMLGTQPSGKNYLADHAITIAEDAIFKEVRDRSNANFLWFIKFERTFREAEETLQKTEDNVYSDVTYPQGSSSERKLRAVHDRSYTQGADIIRLLPAETPTGNYSGDNFKKRGARVQPAALGKRTKASKNIIEFRNR